MRRLLAAALLPFSALLHAESEVDRQIDQAVERYLAAQLQQEARRQGWQGMRFSHASSALNGTARLTACQGPLQVEGADDSPAPLGRQRLKVSCDDQPGWTVLVSSQASVFIPALHAGQVIERGQGIEAGQLQVQELNAGKATRGYFQRPEEVLGMSAKRRIRAGQPLSPGLLTSPLLVKRGQQVKIVASRDGIQASTLGEALQNGQQDDVIKVRNLNSEKVIEAKVLEAGLVSSTFE
ncbi:flagellar basal body P-ring formation chaperone FlgA [Zestomonas carbonaria]|uniref:flagellar basal body P-ring formation chaperone FlgA n=1 Tax=Zestomonas carbonaria TaxID=2762745 RepID=UPI001F373B0C|nr:flagellar basal body P-ring formation chaperone FlgA [Pseudomonas carbonaria]